MNARRSTARLATWLAVLLAIGAVGAACAGPALAHGPDPLLGGTDFAQDQSVGYTWKADQVPPAWMQAAIDAAAADSNASRASRAAVLARAAGAPSLVSYGEPAPCGAIGIACANRDAAPSSFRMWIRAQGYMFDWGALRWCQAPGTNTTGCYDAESVALHEFGHAQNLGHHADLADQSDWADSVMHTIARTKPKAGYNPRAYGRCDTARLQLEYDRPTFGAPFSTCLAIPTVTSLAAYPTSIAPGTSVRFTASLRTASGAAYRALSNDPVSSRAVVLQRRTPGTSTWTSVLTMSPSPVTAGLYTATWSPTATFEWRALFAAPPTEGLTGSSSAAVSVTVSGCTVSGCAQAADR
jgi:hypothetical protein